MKHATYLKIILLFAVLLSLIACQKELPIVDKNLSYLPADAATIISILPRKWIEKSQFDTIDNSDNPAFWVDNMAKRSVLLENILKSPKESGLLLDQPMYLSNLHVLLKNAPKSTDEWRLVFSLQDAKSFEQYIRASEVLTIEQQDSCKIAHFKEAKLYWNEKVGVLSNLPKHSPGDLLSAFNEAAINDLATNPDLGKCLARKVAFSIWTNLDFLANDNKTKSMLALAGFSPTLLKHNYTHTHFSFEAGRIDAETAYHLNPQLQRELGYLLKEVPNSRLAPYIAQENLLAIFTLSLDPRGLIQLLEEHPPLQIPINRMTKQFGIESKELLRCLGGDLLMAYYRIGSITSSLVAMNIQDTSLAQKLLKALQKNHIIEARGKFWKLNLPNWNPDAPDAPHMMLQDEILFISDDLNQLKDIEQRKLPKVALSPYAPFSETTIGAHWQFPLIDSTSTSPAQEIIQDFQLTSDLQSARWMIHFRDTNTNSLQQLREWKKPNQEAKNPI